MSDTRGLAIAGQLHGTASDESLPGHFWCVLRSVQQSSLFSNLSSPSSFSLSCAFVCFVRRFGQQYKGNCCVCLALSNAGVTLLECCRSIWRREQVWIPSSDQWPQTMKGIKQVRREDTCFAACLTLREASSQIPEDMYQHERPKTGAEAST